MVLCNRLPNLKARWLWSLASSHSTGMAPWTSTPANPRWSCNRTTRAWMKQSCRNLEKEDCESITVSNLRPQIDWEQPGAHMCLNMLAHTQMRSTRWAILKCWKKILCVSHPKIFWYPAVILRIGFHALLQQLSHKKIQQLQTETLWWILLYKQRCCFWIWTCHVGAHRTSLHWWLGNVRGWEGVGRGPPANL